MHKIFCGVFLALLASSAFALPFTGVYFFGDSLTDTGNVMERYAAIPVKPPGAPAVIPGAPYDPQGRASNGMVYADVLAQGLGFNALASERGGNNYAFGGARTRYQIFGPPFLGINAQVAAYRALPGPADPDALYVVWAGSNNLQDIFLGRTLDVFGQPIPGVGATIVDIRQILLDLYAEGARNVFVPNVANLGRVPRVRELGGPAGQAQATGLVRAYNGLLNSLLDSIEQTLADLEIIRFDSFTAIDELITSGRFSNTTDRCYTGDDQTFTGGGSVCANPDSYVFWDGIHPTTAAHQLVGERMLAAVLASAVPEPSSLALLSLPLALGWRRFRRTAAHR